MEEKLIKNEALSDKDISMLKENFLIEYCKKKGWDKNNLSVEQLLEISNKKEYKTPGMLKS